MGGPPREVSWGRQGPATPLIAICAGPGALSATSVLHVRCTGKSSITNAMSGKAVEAAGDVDVAAASATAQPRALLEVPRGRCWVEGDNAATIRDSRGPSGIGHVPLGLLEGQAVAVLWPPWRVRRLLSPVAPFLR